MNEPELYPPPDFSWPPPSSFQAPQQQQQQPRTSSFHPGMWSWVQPPVAPSWNYVVSPGWYQGEAAASSSQQDQGGYEHRQRYGREWYQGGPPGGRMNFRPLHQHGRKQKNKWEPEYSHYCDTCDRGFKTQDKYDEHVSQHVKCSVSDCNFTACEKLVSVHWKNNHAPGAKRIKLDTPEEICKWREERRKNYPTLQNIEKKKKVVETREQTGGVLETAQFGRMRGRGRGRGCGWGNRGFRGRHPQEPHPTHSCSTEPPNHPPRDQDPLGVLDSSSHDSDKEDPAPESRAAGLVVAPKQMSSALGSLLANYGSMSESDEEPEAVPIQRAKELVQENKTTLNRVQTTPGIPGPPRGLETSTEMDQVPPSGSNMVRNWRGRGRRGRQDTPQKRRPTLLEMLLAPDIRHERNVLLQCVRYIVHNDFFGLESIAQDQQSSTRTVQDDPSPEGRSEVVSCPVGGVAPETRPDERLGSDHLESGGSSDGDLIQNAKETNGSSDTTRTDWMYDEEIWESNQDVL